MRLNRGVTRMKAVSVTFHLLEVNELTGTGVGYPGTDLCLLKRLREIFELTFTAEKGFT